MVVNITCSGEIQKIEWFPRVILKGELVISQNPIAYFSGAVSTGGPPPPPPPCFDGDGDGYNITAGCGLIDCDDNNINIWHPGLQALL